MSLSDKQIIDNTHIVPEDDGTVTMQCPLPGGHVYKVKAENAESAKKNVLKFCNAVRDYQAYLERSEEEERLAKKSRRKEGIESPKEEAPVVQPGGVKASVLTYFDSLQVQIDELGEKIKADTEKRNALRDERDELEPIIKAWRGVSGEG